MLNGYQTLQPTTAPTTTEQAASGGGPHSTHAGQAASGRDAGGDNASTMIGLGIC